VDSNECLLSRSACPSGQAQLEAEVVELPRLWGEARVGLRSGRRARRPAGPWTSSRNQASHHRRQIDGWFALAWISRTDVPNKVGVRTNRSQTAWMPVRWPPAPADHRTSTLSDGRLVTGRTSASAAQRECVPRTPYSVTPGSLTSWSVQIRRRIHTSPAPASTSNTAIKPRPPDPLRLLLCLPAHPDLGCRSRPLTAGTRGCS
jgi:hypothetical protein